MDMRNLRNRELILLAGFLALAGLILLAAMNFYESEANFTLYRFAGNLLAGRGLVYWMPDSAGATLTTYPLVPLLLVAARTILPGLESGLAAWAVSVVMLGAGAYLLSRLAGGRPAPGVVYILAAAVQPSPIALTAVTLALATLDRARARRWTLAGLCMAAAILAEPAAAILALLLLIPAAAQGWPTLRQYALLAMVLPVLVLYTQGRLFDPAGAHFLAIAPGMLAAMLIPAAIWLAAQIGLPRPLMIGAALVFSLARIGLNDPAGFINNEDLSPQQQVGQWLADNGAAQAVIATDQVGVLAYYAQGRVVDLREADQFFMFHHAPDVVVLRDGQRVPWDGFATTYAQVQQVAPFSVFQRVIDWAGLGPNAVRGDVNVNFSARVGRDDLRLLRVALAPTIKAGQFVRLRLDWQLAYTPRRDVDIKLNLLSTNGQPVAGQRDRLPPEIWRAGVFSTYHAFAVPGEVPTGKYALYLGVEINAASMGELAVAELEVVP